MRSSNRIEQTLKMKIFLMVNNWVGLQVTKFLKKKGSELVGLCVHPLKKAKFRERIIQSAELPKEHIFDGSKINDEKTIKTIRELKPNLGISILFDYLLKKPFLDIFTDGVINLHPSYLPYNRGQYPNVWSIVEGTPAGTSLHFIDEDIDSGDIISQKEVTVEPIDNGATLYRKLEIASVDLFKATWPSILEKNFTRNPQDPSNGTYHRTKDVEDIDYIDLDRHYRAKDLLNILRARTFPPHKGAYFTSHGKKIYISIQLTDDKD